MSPDAAAAHPFPRLRWLGVAWLAVYLPSYAAAYGWLNFLFLCNLGVMLTAIALWRGDRLLLSSQAVASLGIGAAWAADFFTRLLTGDFLFGGTAYMWEPRYPLATRLLSLYHLGWPLLLLFLLRRVGYDRRGWPLQAAIAVAALLASRLFTDPAENVNYAFRDPLFGVAWGPGAVHLLTIATLLGLVVYGATHWILVSFGLPPAAPRVEASSRRGLDIVPPPPS